MLVLGIIAIIVVGGFIAYKVIKKHGGLPVFYWRKGGAGLLSNEFPMAMTNPIYDSQIKDLQASIGGSSNSSSSGTGAVDRTSTDNHDLLMSSSASSWKHEEVHLDDAIKNLEEIVLN